MKRWYHIVAITVLVLGSFLGSIGVVSAQDALVVPPLELASAVTVPGIVVQPAAPLPSLEPVALSGLWLYDINRGESASAGGVLYVLKTLKFSHSYLSVGPEYVGAFFDADGFISYAGGGVVWKVTDTTWLANLINRVPFVRRVPILWAECQANAGAGAQVNELKNVAVWAGLAFSYGR